MSSLVALSRDSRAHDFCSWSGNSLAKQASGARVDAPLPALRK
jgi:hypothetical protein